MGTFMQKTLVREHGCVTAACLLSRRAKNRDDFIMGQRWMARRLASQHSSLDKYNGFAFYW